MCGTVGMVGRDAVTPRIFGRRDRIGKTARSVFAEQLRMKALLQSLLAALLLGVWVARRRLSGMNLGRGVSRVFETVCTFVWHEASERLTGAGQTASTVCAAALRSRCLSLTKTCSIGFRSGEYFGPQPQVPLDLFSGTGPGPCLPWTILGSGQRKHDGAADPKRHGALRKIVRHASIFSGSAVAAIPFPGRFSFHSRMGSSCSRTTAPDSR